MLKFLDNNDISFEDRHCDPDTTHNYSSQKKSLNGLLNDLEDLLKAERSTDKNVSLNTNQAVYNKIFEQIIAVLPEHERLFGKLLVGYNDIIQSYVNNINSLSDERKANDSNMVQSNNLYLSPEYNSLNKKYQESVKLIHSKDQEIAELKTKLASIETTERVSNINLLSTQSNLKEGEDNWTEHDKNVISKNY